MSDTPLEASAAGGFMRELAILAAGCSLVTLPRDRRSATGDRRRADRADDR